MKFLISCNPRGAINFLSRVSFIDLVNKSEFLTKLPHHPRDQILADLGFTMKDEFACIADSRRDWPCIFYCDLQGV